jgi:predicted transcriptional regulator
MPRPASEYPTELELQILRILWHESPLPVREIRLRLAGEGRDIAHTSVITTLNFMVRKKYLQRKKQKNAFLFQPRVSREKVAREMLGDVVDRVFDGSATAVMLSLFSRSEINPDELKELRSIIHHKLKEQSP